MLAGNKQTKMNNTECYKYFIRNCPFFWQISRQQASVLLKGKPSGSFVLRPSDEDQGDMLFAISFVWGSDIEEGHLLPMNLELSGIHLINVKHIAQQHKNHPCKEEHILYGLRRNTNDELSLKNLAISAFLKNHTWEKIDDWSTLSIQRDFIFKLGLPASLMDDIFALYVCNYANFKCFGILPELE